jgi:hypothetical protein
VAISLDCDFPLGLCILDGGPECVQKILMKADTSTAESHRARSSFVRELVQRSNLSLLTQSTLARKPPRMIIQFWDIVDRIPKDVSECIETWRKVEVQGVERRLFDKLQARDFIDRHLGQRYVRAFEQCYHPAMQSDYFRLCYLFIEGGCYVDADDVYDGDQIQHLFSDGRLKIQPLCYDTATDLMVPPQIFTEPGANADSWIFYFNNNPLIAGSNHPLIRRALDEATLSLEKDLTNGLPEIQSTTGPGNLTKSIFDAVTENADVEKTLHVLCTWENIARCRWDLGYRGDLRNWRLSNCQTYPERLEGDE